MPHPTISNYFLEESNIDRNSSEQTNHNLTMDDERDILSKDIHD